MKYIISLVTALCSLFGFAHAQKNTTTNSLLWKISKDGVKTSYLFGTIHLICKSDYIWTDVMKKSLAASDKLCLEMDMDNQQEMMQTYMGLLDQSGKTLKDKFTPEQYEKIKRYLKDSMNVDIALFDKMKPFALMSLFIQGVDGCDSTVSYEQKLMDEAHSAQKEVLGLESGAEQLKAIEQMSEDSIIHGIIEFIEHPEKQDDELQKMVAAYKKQDLKELYKIISTSEDMGEMKGPLLDERNARWISRISDMSKQQSVFYAVGAGHLWGDKGVLNLLKKDGYKVEAVTK